MGFKKVQEYNEQRFGGMFVLRNDKEYADVVFLYQSIDDVLIAEETHYIKSSEYSGYVHCCGKGCPACAKKIRVEPKLFIPLYNITAGEVQFWDRTARFELQLLNDVFSKFANPSKVIFRITRNGAPRDVNTRYTIAPVGSVDAIHTSYDKICADNNIIFPDYYEKVCRSVTEFELNNMFNVSEENEYGGAADLPSYQVTPRGVTPASQLASIPQTPADIPDYNSVESEDGVYSLPEDEDGEPVF